MSGELTDGEGFAVDDGMVYLFNYNDGAGTLLGNGGTWGAAAGQVRVGAGLTLAAQRREADQDER